MIDYTFDRPRYGFIELVINTENLILIQATEIIRFDWLSSKGVIDFWHLLFITCLVKPGPQCKDSIIGRYEDVRVKCRDCSVSRRQGTDVLNEICFD